MSNFQIPVKLYMRAPVHSIPGTEQLEAAHRRLEELGISCLGVTDDQGRLAGVISRTDLLRVGAENGAGNGSDLLTLPARPVSKCMTVDVATVAPDDPVSQASKLMADRRLHRVFVVADGRPAGVLSTRDVMRAVREKRVNHPISRYMSSPVFTIRASEPISLATERLARAKVSGLAVLDGDWPVGLFTQREALASRDLPRDTPVEKAMDPRLICLGGDTPLYRATEQAAALDARRILVLDDHRKLAGILTGIDLAQATA